MDTYDFLADPRAITLADRRATAARMAREQQVWLERLQSLTEPPHPGRDFPAFLLALPAFADLALRLGTATQRSQLGTEVADELDWFVRAFTEYLRTTEAEDVFTSPPVRAS